MDIDLFLFGQAFQETWKLQKGMVIVLLNPQIYKQKQRNSFSLRMTSNKTPLSMDHQQQQASSDLEGGESVLEVGFARDWAGCEALKADGAVCGDWVDTRHARVCAWHVDQGMKRARKGRMEYAVGYIPFPPRIPFRYIYLPRTLSGVPLSLYLGSSCFTHLIRYRHYPYFPCFLFFVFQTDH